MVLLLGIAFMWGFAKVMSSDRWPVLAPARRLWAEWTPRAKAFVYSAPGTFIYLFVLVITTWVLQTSSNSTANVLLLERSTNLYQLTQNPVKVLVTSAFWVGGPVDLLVFVFLFTIFAARVERWLGTARTATIFFTGHVGATLIVALWLWGSLSFTVVKSSLTTAQDVGASYGLAALVGVLTYAIVRRLRWFYVGALFFLASLAIKIQPDFTSWGHLVALGIGFGSYFLIPDDHRHSAVVKT